MGGVNLGNFAHIHNIDSGAIDQLRDKTGYVVRDGGEGTLQIGSNSFKVSIVDGNVKLAFTSGNRLTNLFRSDTLSRTRDRLQGLYGQAVRDDNAAMLDRTKPSNDVVSGILNGNEEKVTIVNRGFAWLRDAAASEIRSAASDRGKGVNLISIDSYNDHCGIKADDVLANYDETISNIRNDTLKMRPEQAGLYTNASLSSWKTILRENVNKLDIFGRIGANITEATNPNGRTTGWAGEIRRHGVDAALEMMIKKNIDPSDLGLLKVGYGRGEKDLAVLTALLKDMVYFNTRNKDPETCKQERNALIEARLEKYPNKDILRDVFKRTVSTMFSRQTSKLGLKFFSQNDIPVVFQWQSGGGKTITSADLQDKWWKTGGKISDHSLSDSITLSEMRYVERNHLDNVTRVRGAQ